MNEHRTSERSKDACALCGKDPAAGFAMIDYTRYCHGDGDPDPTCYMKAQWLMLPTATNFQSSDA